MEPPWGRPPTAGSIRRTERGPDRTALSRKENRLRVVSGRGWFLGDELDEVATGVVEDRNDRLANVGGRLGE